jgi:hypothetical protein
MNAYKVANFQRINVETYLLYLQSQARVAKLVDAPP